MEEVFHPLEKNLDTQGKILNHDKKKSTNRKTFDPWEKIFNPHEKKSTHEKKISTRKLKVLTPEKMTYEAQTHKNIPPTRPTRARDTRDLANS